MQKYNVIGVMSGTSLDGLDIAHCSFQLEDRWSFRLLEAKTIPYDTEWKNRLGKLLKADGETLATVHTQFGEYIGKRVRVFIRENGLSPDYIACHGHTVFHQPENRMTLQIGDGNVVAVETGIPVIYDFRSRDIALGGQGAPLVPIGDRLLFPDYDLCLNLGGIANISYEEQGVRRAFDVCPVNMLLNHLSGELGQSYDQGGRLSRSGTLHSGLLDTLNGLDFYKVRKAKTLGREWFDGVIVPLVSNIPVDVKDKLRTAVEHIAYQIAESLSAKERGKMLVTGGGAYNAFLIEKIREKSRLEVIVPGEDLVNFKEALVFAFLGVLRVRHEINCLASVTGARQDSCGGIITA
jgi:anhydro-N-acetylmuramic acid kinase